MVRWHDLMGNRSDSPDLWRQLPLNAIADFHCPIAHGTMAATEHHAFVFDTVAKDLAATMSADWRESLNGALEGIENMLVAGHGNGERLIEVVAAYFTLHRNLLEMTRPLPGAGR
jgi:hypothetical protein